MTAAQPQDRERNVSTDVLRGLAIVLVVFGHACRGVIEKAGGASVDGLSNLDFALYTTHMPAFFVIAGYYTERSLRSRSAPAYLATRFWDVVYPYVLWSILYWIIHLIMGRFTHINHPITVAYLLADTGGITDLATLMAAVLGLATVPRPRTSPSGEPSPC